MKITEHYGRLKESSRQFDIAYWQQQGPAAIFAAAEDMIRDYFLLKYGHADELRLSRSVENFQKK